MAKAAPDCTEWCRSTVHGDLITAAITKRCVSDLHLCSYLAHLCANCENVKDSSGRTALHVAASCGRTTLARWLCSARHANLAARDDESGFSPLHRAVFYGKLATAVSLLQLHYKNSGMCANDLALDADSLSPLDHAALDGPSPSAHASGELYAWGSNCNHSLGPHCGRAKPELFDAFHTAFADEVREACVGEFHSALLGASGRAYACGHGRGGRLGLGAERTALAPERVRLPERALAVAVARDHSLFLTASRKVYACGANANGVLGLSPPPAGALAPAFVRQLDVERVAAGRYHSLAWGARRLYAWGLNAGQLGLPAGERRVPRPRPVGPFGGAGAFALVACADAATVVYTGAGDVYALHEYRARRVASRQLGLVQVAVCGGRLDAAVVADADPGRELRVGALTGTGNVLVWSEGDPQLLRCVFALSRPVVGRQLVLNSGSLLLVTKEGELFEGFCKPRRRRQDGEEQRKLSAFHRFLERDDCVSVRLRKFPRVYRALSVASDPKGVDFLVVQARPYRTFEAPALGVSQFGGNFARLLDEANEADDVHDLVFGIGGRVFPAHRFVIASKCLHFGKVLADSGGGKVVELNELDVVAFRQFLQFCYTGGCELLAVGETGPKFDDESSSEVVDEVERKQSAYQVYKQRAKEVRAEQQTKKSARGPIRMLHEIGKKFGCVELCEILTLKEKEKKKLMFDRLAGSDYFDVTIKCNGGMEEMAHKAVLSAHSEYFNMVFSSRWQGIQTQTISLNCSHAILKVLLEYLYTDLYAPAQTPDQDQLLKLLTLSDELFLFQLKEQCEQLLLNYLTLKTCTQFLNFAHTFSAPNLKACCMAFITANLAPLLEVHALDTIEADLLDELSQFYFDTNPKIQCRVITPYSTAASDEEIAEIGKNWPIRLDEQVEKSQKVAKRRVRNRRAKEEQQEHNVAESVIQFPDSPDCTDSVEISVPSRLKAIQLAHAQVLSDELLEPEFTALISKDDFPVLSGKSDLVRSPPAQKSEMRYRPLRLSQKQRKRLSSESGGESVAGESPKNPWKLNELVATSPKAFEVRISDIISEERKQKENFVKMTSKLLIYTQIEDTAIVDLRKFYNCENENDEFIWIERVEIGAVAAPFWVSGIKKLDS